MTIDIEQNASVEACRFPWIILANPKTPSGEAYRYVFLGADTVDLVRLLYRLGCMLVFIIGSIILNRVE